MITQNQGKQRITRFTLFIMGICFLKIVLMGIFSSDYQNELFMKFIECFLEQIKKGNLINPYEYFNRESNLFPYPPVMLIIESVGGMLSAIAKGNLFWKNVLFKMPNLFFDGLGMYYLIKMFPGKRKYIAVIYFASPIIMYSTYMHGQLDIIPTILFIGAVAHLTAQKQKESKRFILFLAASILCKFHILAAVPILILFIAKRDGWARAITTLCICIPLCVFCILPFWGTGFLSNVLLNNEQSVLTKITLDFINIKIYVPILAVILIYLNVFTISKINKDLLYSLCGILFSVFLVLVPPMPGWYVWIVPFITIFFIDIRSDRYLNLTIYILLNISYLVYFLLAHSTSYIDLYYFEKSMMWMKIDNPLFVNGAFTILTSVLLYSIYMMYCSGIASNSFYRRRSLPFTIGVSGDSGSGKSSFVSMVELIFGNKNLLFIEGDGDHKWERGDSMWKYFTHLNPKSNYLYRQAQDLAALRAGQSVMRVDYNHDTGKFTKNNKMRPKPYILLCGLHALYLPQVRNYLDLKVYMDIDETLRRYWKINRDVSTRNYSKGEILKQIIDRMPDAKKYIYPQKKYADLVISYFDKELKDCLTETHIINLSLRITLNIAIDLEPLIWEIRKYGIGVEYDYDDDLNTQVVTFEGEALEGRSLPISEIAEQIVPHLDEIINHPLEAKDDLHGILEIVLLLLIGRKLQGDDINA